MGETVINACGRCGALFNPAVPQWFIGADGDYCHYCADADIVGGVEEMSREEAANLRAEAGTQRADEHQDPEEVCSIPAQAVRDFEKECLLFFEMPLPPVPFVNFCIRNVDSMRKGERAIWKTATVPSIITDVVSAAMKGLGEAPSLKRVMTRLIGLQTGKEAKSATYKELVMQHNPIIGWDPSVPLAPTVEAYPPSDQIARIPEVQAAWEKCFGKMPEIEPVPMPKGMAEALTKSSTPEIARLAKQLRTILEQEDPKDG